MSSGFQHSDAQSTKLYAVNSAHYLEVESTPSHTKHGQAAARITGKLTLRLLSICLATLLSRQFLNLMTLACLLSKIFFSTLLRDGQRLSSAEI